MAILHKNDILLVIIESIDIELKLFTLTRNSGKTHFRTVKSAVGDERIS